MKDHRITVMFPVNYLGVGGAEQQLLELVRGIDKTRFNPLVVSLYPGGALEPEVRQVPGAELISVNRKGKYDFWILTKMFSVLRQKRVDIVQPFLTPATFFGLLPALINRTAVRIMTERGGFRSETKLGFRLYQKAEDLLARFDDLIVANSEAGKSYLISRGINPGHIKVIYNGMNLERLIPDQTRVMQIRRQLRLPPNGMVVGMTASISSDKDQTTFIRGAKIIHQAMPQTRFALLGDGPLRPRIEDLVKESGLEQFVTFFGNQRDIASYVSCYDIACLCADSSEGCSNVILESMALEKPVVATDGGGNSEVVEHAKTGLLVPMQDPEAFADAVLTCLRQPDWARDMGRHAREVVLTRFSLARMVSDYEQLYKQAMRAKGRVSRYTLAGQ
jgi:glycosyltransferase involved in cell wall biosynthesis